MTPIYTCLLLLSILDGTRAQREVEVQPGTLFRTVGSHITIWCKVRGYQGPTQQDFRWSIYLPSAPEREVQVVSTEDASFPYAIYSQRVRSGDIYVERVSGDHAVLHISQLQERDSGEYECHTPNTDPTYHGSYSAKMNLTVIPDTLRVAMPGQKLLQTEGDPMVLTCHVSKASVQHTHLSVTWLRESETAGDAEILTLSREFVLRAGPAYVERFASGDVRLDKLNQTSYRFSMMGLRVTDRGATSCRASEWIQDPGGIWTKITEKQSESSSVGVSAPEGRDFVVTLWPSSVALITGNPLEVLCSISSQVAFRRRYRVVWLLDNSELATWSPSGVSSFEGQYGARGARGELVLGRRSQDSWYLRISRVRVEDGGAYGCLVSEEENGGTRRIRHSNSESVNVTETGSTLRVTLRTDGPRGYEGDSARFWCQADGFSGSLSVAWSAVGSSGEWVEVASLRRDGELSVGQNYLPRHGGGHLVAEKLGPGDFFLKLGRISAGDEGRYSCGVTEWRPEPDGGWRNASTQKQDAALTVIMLGPSLRVALSVRTPAVIMGGSVGLVCAVSAPYSLVNRTLLWAWDFCPGSGPCTEFLELVRTSPNGGLSWGDSGFSGKAQLSVSERRSALRLHHVQRGQTGTYRCGVRTEETTQATSNNLMIRVSLPGSQLKVDETPRVLMLGNGDDQLAVTCHIHGRTPHTFLTITWLFRPLTAPTPQEILRVSQEGVSTLLAPTQGSRLLSDRVTSDTFILRILRADLSQLGSYHCVVGEWLRGEAGEWIPLEEKTSGATAVEFRRSEKTLNIPKTNRSAEVAEGQDVELYCPLGVVPNSMALHSVSWYYRDSTPHPARLLFHAGWDGVTHYEESRSKRLRLLTTTRGNYSLVLHRVGQNDTGTYHCQAEEWRQEAGRGGWRLEDSDVSGYTQLTITAPGDHLRLNRTEFALLVPAPQSLLLPCQVLSVSRTDSALSVSWWKSVAPGAQEELVLRVSPWGQFRYPSAQGAQLLQYERPSQLNFQLRILQPEQADSGVYHCRVQEWVPDARGVWNPGKERRAGNISATILPAGEASEVCSPRPLFYALVVVAVLFILLVSALVWLFLSRRRLRNQRVDHMRRGRLGLMKECAVPMKDRE